MYNLLTTLVELDHLNTNVCRKSMVFPRNLSCCCRSHTNLLDIYDSNHLALKEVDFHTTKVDIPSSNSPTPRTENWHKFRIWEQRNLQKTYQTFTSLALIDPLFTTLKSHMLKLLVLTRLFRIALWTAQFPVFRLPPFWTITWLFLTRYDAFWTGTDAARLVSWTDLHLVRNFVVLEHAAKLTLIAAGWNAFRLQRVQRQLHRVKITTFALKVPVSVDTFGWGMTTMSWFFAFVDVNAVVVFHLVTGFAFTIIPGRRIN